MTARQSIVSPKEAYEKTPQMFLPPAAEGTPDARTSAIKPTPIYSKALRDGSKAQARLPLDGHCVLAKAAGHFCAVHT